MWKNKRLRIISKANVTNRGVDLPQSRRRLYSMWNMVCGHKTAAWTFDWIIADKLAMPVISGWNYHRKFVQTHSFSVPKRFLLPSQINASPPHAWCHGLDLQPFSSAYVITWWPTYTVADIDVNRWSRLHRCLEQAMAGVMSYTAQMLEVYTHSLYANGLFCSHWLPTRLMDYSV